jgi:peptidyl-prolyl cis-trans isomerase SurA
MRLRFSVLALLLFTLSADLPLRGQVPSARPSGAGTNPDSAPKALQMNGLAARVNTRFITKNEVNDSVKALSMMLIRKMMDPTERESEMKNIRDRALEDLIEREVVLSEYERMGGKLRVQMIDEDIARIIRENFDGDRSKFLRELSRQGLSWTKFKELHEKRLIVTVMAQQAAGSVGYPTPEQKQDFFKKNEDAFREDARIKLRTIAIPKLSAEGLPGAQRKIADEIRRRVASGGAEFGAEARSYSADAKATEGGDWGWVPREGVLAKELADVAFSLAKGAVSPVFEFRGLYYILYIEDKELGKLKPQTEIDEVLERAVMNDMRKAARSECGSKS